MGWDGATGIVAHDRTVDLRPVVWDATVVTPRDDRGVTIVIRVTYRTLEEICLDLGPLSYTGAAASRFFLSSSAS